MKNKKDRNWQDGSIGEFIGSVFCILAMVTVMVFFMECMELIYTKTQVNQLARQYILRMETKGCLDTEDMTALLKELQELGVTDPRLQGSTLERVEYGGVIRLQIRGILGENYEFEEKRCSTAKN